LISNQIFYYILDIESGYSYFLLAINLGGIFNLLFLYSVKINNLIRRNISKLKPSKIFGFWVKGATPSCTPTVKFVEFLYTVALVPVFFHTLKNNLISGFLSSISLVIFFLEALYNPC